MAEKMLTKEIAEEFLADDESVDLEEFTELDDDAAESLSKYEWGLYLRGLTSLSDAAAQSLSKHEGELELTGLTSLSDAAAESLSKHNGEFLVIGLTSLSDATAELREIPNPIDLSSPYFALFASKLGILFCR